MAKLLQILTLTILLLACSKPPPVDIEKNFIVGVWGGLCTECHYFYMVDTEDKPHEYCDNNYIGPNGPDCWDPSNMSPSNLNALLELRDNLPSELLDAEAQTYGQPDAYDQQGFYIEYFTDTDKSKVWLIDTDTINLESPTIQELALSIQETIDKLK